MTKTVLLCSYIVARCERATGPIRVRVERTDATSLAAPCDAQGVWTSARSERALSIADDITSALATLAQR